MNKKIFIAIIAAFYFAIPGGTPLQAAEPNMADYTNVPPFLSNATTPNILIMLDNSGSMNYSAYGQGRDGGGLENGNEYQGIVQSNFTSPVDVRVIDPSDDAEELVSNGDIWRNSSDLELVDDYGSHGGPQVIGIRFQGLQVPHCVTITAAYIEFETDETSSGTTNLLIQGQAADDAPGFTYDLFNISSRITTAAATPWNVPTWSVVSQKHQTPDLTAIIQEIVDRDGWRPGNAMAFIISGTGRRVVESYNGESSNAPLLHIEWVPAPAGCEEPPPTTYYGYFNPEWFYTYTGNMFVHDYKKLDYGTAPCAADEWQVENTSSVQSCLNNAAIVSQGLFDGNWMNWMASRRVDIARKVLMGGLVDSNTPRSSWGTTGPGQQTVLFDNHSDQTGRWWTRRYNSTGLPAVTPHNGDFYYGMYMGRMYVDNNSDLSSIEAIYTLAVDKLEIYEPDDFFNGNVAGVLQKVGDQARWGLEFFNTSEGGYIDENVTMGTGIDNMVDTIEAKKANTWTPLAESFWVAMSYFMQQDDGMGYPDNIPIGNAYDPFYNSQQDPLDPYDDYEWCRDSFVILFTDGASTQDLNIPNQYKDYDEDGDDSTFYSSNGSNYLDDLALYANTMDLRPNLECNQNLILYPIYAFGSDPNAQELLRAAAINGGFVDKGLLDNKPNDPAVEAAVPQNEKEWDRDGDGIPDTYFEATDGAQLESELIKAIQDILNRASSGTSVSVLATSSEGEGTVVQAYFNPVVSTKESGSFDTVSWAGYLQSFWVDSHGNLREDTIKDGILTVEEDKVVKYVASDSSDPCKPGGLSINTYDVSLEDYYPDTETECSLNPVCTNIIIEELSPIWEAGSILAKTEADNRQIFTNLNTSGTNFSFADFSIANAAAIRPYLGVKDAATWEYLGDGSDGERGENLIKYTLGHDTGFAGATQTRNRTIGFINDGNTIIKTWKLGDIVNSTPVSVAAPPDKFGLIYTDGSYEDYERKYTVRKTNGKIISGRESMVYVGANDGMLHAFSSWIYDRKEKEFVKPDDATKVDTALLNITVPAWETEIGTELWAFVPQTMLPHLKWLADPEYSHVNYIDLKPKVADARIFTVANGYPANDPDHPNGWGTVLIGGMRFGGKEIEVTDDFGGGVVETKTFTSSYFAIDITNPRNPQLLWEKSFDDMGLTTFNPSIAKVGQLEFNYETNSFIKEDDKWFVVLGSGPTAAANTFDGFNGISSSTGKVYIVDIASGEPYPHATKGKDWLFETVDNNAVMGGSASFDYALNYNVDAIYFTESHITASGENRGAIYKVTVPWQCDGGDCTVEDYGIKDQAVWPAIIGLYGSNPLGDAASDPWSMHKLFDAPRPLTAPPSLSIDNDNSTPGLGSLWIYFGTGRFLTEDDRTTIDQEYLFGIKDPFFNEQHKFGGKFNDGFYHNWSTSLLLEDTAMSSTIMDVSDFEIITPGRVYSGSTNLYSWNTLLNKQREEFDGWKMALIAQERAVTKPVIFGGIALFSTFVPNCLICGYDGVSYIYGLYYQSGTANTEAVFEDDYSLYLLGKTKVNKKTSLGIGMASSPAIHAAKQKDDKISAFVQQSTGAVTDIRIDTERMRSGLRSWQDMSIQAPPDPAAP